MWIVRLALDRPYTFVVVAILITLFGYLSVTKSFQNNRPLTTCALTPAGKKAFTHYLDLLERIIRQNRPE